MGGQGAAADFGPQPLRVHPATFLENVSLSMASSRIGIRLAARRVARAGAHQH